MENGDMQVVGLVLDNQNYPQWVEIQCIKYNGNKINITIDNNGGNIEVYQMEFEGSHVFDVPTHLPNEEIITECYNYENMDYNFHIAGITCNDYINSLNFDLKDLYFKVDNQEVLRALETVRANKDAKLKDFIGELNNPLEKDLKTLREGLNELESIENRINNLKRVLR